MKTNTTQQTKLPQVATIYGCGHRVGTPSVSMAQVYDWDAVARKPVFVREQPHEHWYTMPTQCPECFAQAMKRLEEQKKAEGGCYDWIGEDACF